MSKPKLKILHLMHANKWVTETVKTFDEYNRLDNLYILGINVSTENRSYIDSLIKLDHKIKLYDLYKLEDFQNIFSEFDPNVLIIHGLKNYKLKFINTLDTKTVIVWRGLGLDLYSKIEFEELQPKTERLVFYTKKKKYLGLFFLYRVNQWKNKAKRKLDILRYFAKYKRIDLVNSPSIFEKELFAQLGLSEKYCGLSMYYDFKCNKPYSIPEQDNVWLGSSCDPSNNHIEVVDYLSKSLFKGKIYIPLNYQINKDYRELLIKEGKKAFDERFIPITQWLNKENYVETVKSCRYAIYNANRQKGFADILFSIAEGKVVLISSQSPICKELKQRGFSIFSFDPNKTYNIYSLSLTSEQITNNKNLIEQFYSLDGIRKRNQLFFEKLDQIAYERHGKYIINYSG